MRPGAVCRRPVGGTRHAPATRATQRGAALVDVVISLAMLVVLAAVALPTLAHGLGDQQTRQAARHLAGRLHRARFEALRVNAHVAVVFGDAAEGWPLVIARDGNGNGVRRLEVEQGIDPVITGADRIGAHWPSVSFSVVRSAPGIDGGAALGTGEDPVRVGSSDLVSFSPVGTATSGTMYLAAEGGAQFAVRVMGVTGRVRVLRFDRVLGQWVLQ